jgi:uncharacterized protein
VKQAFLTTLRNPVRTLFTGAIRGYQLVISPGLPGRCKFYPSCSQYALDAIKEYGAARGVVLGAWRILRCNPLSYGGYDPVSRQKLFGRRGKSSPSDAAEAGPEGGGQLSGRPLAFGAQCCSHEHEHCPTGLR